MPVNVPKDVLPIYPTYSTVIKDGIKYKAYFETDWHQVITEDGVPLCELIQSMPSFSVDNFYRFCGILKTTGNSSGMDQLYALTSQKTGDVYLVETDMLTNDGRVCETYVWLGNDHGWVFCGTTDKKASIDASLPDVIKLFPEQLGEPNQVLVVGKDGKSIAWGGYSVDKHNEDPSAHQDIRNEINLKADKLCIYNDIIRRGSWAYNGDYPCFESIYFSEKLPVNSYFEITPVVESTADETVLSNAAISQIYKIHNEPGLRPYAILRSKRVPTEDIKICVKVFGTFNEK